MIGVELMATVNVKDYGAYGDGFHNDTVAFQLACKAVGQGGIVFIPAGNYVINGPINGNGVSMFLGADKNELLYESVYSGNWKKLFFNGSYIISKDNFNG